MLEGVGGIDAAAITAAPDGDAWWIVMRDATDDLLDDTSPLEREDHRRILAALDGMWTAFEGTTVDCLAESRSRLGLPGPPVAGASARVTICCRTSSRSPGRRSGRGEPTWRGRLAVVTDSGPLSASLAARGTTLLHGDVRDEQLGRARGG